MPTKEYDLVRRDLSQGRTITWNQHLQKFTLLLIFSKSKPKQWVAVGHCHTTDMSRIHKFLHSCPTLWDPHVRILQTPNPCTHYQEIVRAAEFILAFDPDSDYEAIFDPGSDHGAITVTFPSKSFSPRFNTLLGFGCHCHSASHLDVISNHSNQKTIVFNKCRKAIFSLRRVSCH